MSQMKASCRIFVASSNDVKKERNSQKGIITKLDQRYDRFGIDLQWIGWEDSVIPDFGMDPQDVINRQIRFDNINIFVCIVWRRIGTPTLRDMSGTIEECNNAIFSRQNTGNPSTIMFFTCDRPFTPSNRNDAHQFQEARKFKSWIDQRALSVHYDSVDDFVDKARDALPMAIDNFLNELRHHNVRPAPGPQYLIVERLGPDIYGIACPWCGPLQTISIQRYKYYARMGKVWNCPRCGVRTFLDKVVSKAMQRSASVRKILLYVNNIRPLA